MITDPKILPKLEESVKRYQDLLYEKIHDIPMEMWTTREHFRQEPTRAQGAQWRPAKTGTQWGDNWLTAWFRGKVKLPRRCDGKPVFVRAKTGAGETLFLVDGEHVGFFEGRHPVRLMTRKGGAGRTYRLALEAYAGHFCAGSSPHGRAWSAQMASVVFEGAELLLERRDVVDFVFDILTLTELVKQLDEHSLRRNAILRGLAGVYAAIDAIPEETGEASWRPKLPAARKIMRPLLEAKNGPTTPWFGISANSHLDTAWLWPLAETWRKAARTFSSTLTLMESYPEFHFMMSPPCHADAMRRLYPGVFKRMQKMAAAGRWEPNGCMWVEPDANITSGESFIRQLLVGMTATREMFDFRPNTLWLPDVFGYSAALPQIMRGCGVEFFCTQKIGWNDTTRFPYDTFVWQGIDGAEVITHFITSYCSRPAPTDVIHWWKNVQHKDVEDRRMLLFGWGDGGGGPTSEMLEMDKRIRDLEGCPRTVHTTVGEFMEGVRDDLKDRLPRWVGELYLEYHRGALTSIAKIKRGNRKTELALRDAEWLWTLAALRAKAKYPAAQLLEIWKALLTNQFHDILPGSSISEVNDEAIATFERVLGETDNLCSSAMQLLAGRASGQRDDLLVFNSLSWERQGEIVLDNAPPRARPADPGIRSQWVQDVYGKRRLAVDGFTIPGLGAAVLELEKGAPRRAPSPFRVTARSVATPHAKVRFDKIGRIVSFIDRSSGREIVKEGGALNSLLIGEDVPQAWDNWDLDRDHRLKMRVEDRLVSREVVANGPVQLRIRSVHKVGAGSTLTQDVVFHASTPRVDFETVVDWNEKHKFLKAGFEFDVLADSARHEIQYGHVVRPTHENLPQDRARFEVCAHKWSDLSEARFGVALLNDCKYGIGVLGSEMRLSLLKSGTHPDWRGDKGRHAFTYALLPHNAPFSVESVVRPGYELNVPPRAARAGAGAEGLEGLVSIDAPNVVIESIKWAEKGKAFVVRFYEAEKTTTAVRMTFRVPVEEVSETNMLEESPRPLTLRGNAVRLNLRAFEIKTLYCRV
ncbi:MAG TPA: glycoside hydrolase family 38 C-terminal domain-containing protein [Sumerlaeia bacterium]|nr:glycoside hydrolase family 38 C-terminal domain-containing protein [Sumerlaeia bacterium]